MDQKNEIAYLVNNFTEEKKNIAINIVKIEQSLRNLDNKVNNDIKQDIWEIKQNIKKITQNEKDIAVLIEKIKQAEILLSSTKETLEAKMVTKKDMDEKKYKDWRLWLAILALAVSFIMPFANKFFSKDNNTRKENVSSYNKK